MTWLEEQMQDPKFRTAYADADFIACIVDELDLAMKQRGMKAEELAKHMEISSERMEEILQGYAIELDEIAKMARMLSLKVTVTIEYLDESSD